MGATFTDLGHVQYGGQKDKKRAKTKLVETMAATYFSSSIKHGNK